MHTIIDFPREVTAGRDWLRVFCFKNLNHAWKPCHLKSKKEMGNIFFFCGLPTWPTITDYFSNDLK